MADTLVQRHARASRHPGRDQDRLETLGPGMDATQPRMLLIERAVADNRPDLNHPARAFLIRFEGSLWHVHVTEWIRASQARALDPGLELGLLDRGRIGCSAHDCAGDGFAVSPWLALATTSAESHTLFMAQCDGRTGADGEGAGARCDNMFRVVMRRVQEGRESG